MAWVADIWPFVPGQQQLILNATGLSVIGLMVLNLVSARRQRLPFHKVLARLFMEVGAQSKGERYIRYALLAWLLVGFLALVLDVQINGSQLVDMEWANKR